MKHFPLDPKCNPSVSSLVHPAACDAAAAAVMARSKGTFDKLTSWFFAHQEELSPATVRRTAAEIGGITGFDAGYARAIEEVKADATTGGALGVAKTPTFFINGRRLEGGLSPQYFADAIDLELKRAK
jgi:protein-disulfide isomerase